MKTWNWIKVSGAVVAASLLVATQARAVIAYNYSSTLAGNQVGGPYSLGNVFNVTTPITIDELAAFDNGHNGIGGGASGIDVAIYKVTISGGNITGGSLVVPSYKFTGTAESLLSGTSTRVAGITPVNLTVSGTYMVVANRYGVGGSEVDYNPNYPSPTGPNLASANTAFGVTYDGGYYNLNGGLTWGATLPSGWVHDLTYTGSPQAPRYAAGNFDFTPVPEAATFGAAAVGFLGLIYIVRYVRIRRTLGIA